jgi:aconitate hydratase
MPRQAVDLEIKRKDGKKEIVPLILRIDTPIEVDYYKNGGILPFVLRDILRAAS